MSNKNQVYLAGVLMYLVAGLAGYVISSYWLVGIVSVLLGVFTAYKTFGNASKDDVYNSMVFDWASILIFAAIEVILTACISVLKLELVGILGFVNLFVQAMGYVFVAVLGRIFLKEKINKKTAIGMGLILVGIVICSV